VGVTAAAAAADTPLPSVQVVTAVVHMTLDRLHAAAAVIASANGLSSYGRAGGVMSLRSLTASRRCATCPAFCMTSFVPASRPRASSNSSCRAAPAPLCEGCGEPAAAGGWRCLPLPLRLRLTLVVPRPAAHLRVKRARDRQQYIAARGVAARPRRLGGAASAGPHRCSTEQQRRQLCSRRRPLAVTGVDAEEAVAEDRPGSPDGRSVM